MIYIRKTSHCLLVEVRAEPSRAGWGREMAAALVLHGRMVGGGKRRRGSVAGEEGDP